MQVLLDLGLELDRLFFGTSYNFRRFLECSEGLWWIGEVVVGGGGGYCAGDTPLAEFLGEVGPQSLVLLFFWWENGPGIRAREGVGLVESRGRGETFEG
jgi:hypothetical protein